MQDELLSLIQNCNVILFLNAFVVFLITNLLKPMIPKSLKKKICLLPFVIGVLLSFVYFYFIIKTKNFEKILESGVQLGGIATLIYAIIKQMLKGNNLEKSISNLLEGIINSSALKNVSQNIIQSFSQSKSMEENSKAIFSLIAESTSISENECIAITNIILKTLTKK